jgi:hypothetical protein
MYVPEQDQIRVFDAAQTNALVELSSFELPLGAGSYPPHLVAGGGMVVAHGEQAVWIFDTQGALLHTFFGQDDVYSVVGLVDELLVLAHLSTVNELASVGMDVFDVSEPANPSFVGRSSGNVYPNRGAGITMAGDLLVVDTNTIAAIVRLDRTQIDALALLSGPGFGGARRLVVDGELAFAFDPFSYHQLDGLPDDVSVRRSSRVQTYAGGFRIGDAVYSSFTGWYDPHADGIDLGGDTWPAPVVDLPGDDQARLTDAAIAVDGADWWTITRLDLSEDQTLVIHHGAADSPTYDSVELPTDTNYSYHASLNASHAVVAAIDVTFDSFEPNGVYRTELFWIDPSSYEVTGRLSLPGVFPSSTIPVRSFASAGERTMILGGIDCQRVSASNGASGPECTRALVVVEGGDIPHEVGRFVLNELRTYPDPSVCGSMVLFDGSQAVVAIENNLVVVDTVAAPFTQRAAVPAPMHIIDATSVDGQRALLLAPSGIGTLELCIQ